MKILFVDPVGSKPYDSNVLRTQPLGGSEATVIRLAVALAAKGHQVRVTQHNRETRDTTEGVEYTPFAHNEDFKATHVIVQRAPLVLYTARKQYPSAKLFLHCHDLFGGEGWFKGFQALIDTQAVPVVVSDYHRSQMYDTMKALKFEGSVPSRRIYNPIDEDLRPDSTPVDPDKMVFFSSPHKGLARTLEVFSRFKDFKELKNVKLYISNPGYFKDHDTSGLENVINLGSLSHLEAIKNVRNAFCSLQFNKTYPETFGLAAVESRAVGVPFLCDRIGAAPETADHPAEFIDTADNEAIIKRLISWRVSRPRVRANPLFRTQRVVRDWIELLGL